jgi:hypothetical protein
MPWRRMGVWRYSSTILDLSTTWRWVVNFTPRPHYPRNPLDRRLGGSLSWSGRCGEDKIPLLLPWIEPRLSSPSLCRLSYPGSKNKMVLIYKQDTFRPIFTPYMLSLDHFVRSPLNIPTWSKHYLADNIATASRNLRLTPMARISNLIHYAGLWVQNDRTLVYSVVTGTKDWPYFVSL